MRRNYRSYATTGLVAMATVTLPFSSLAHANELLFAKYQCSQCHDKNNKIVGPALMEIHKKYQGQAGARDHLISVIKNGNKAGVWGSIPCQPSKFGGKVSDAEAKALAKWILDTLK